MDSFVDNRSPQDKMQLLRNVSKKIFKMSQTLPELEILDFAISKTDRKLNFNVGYKQEIRTDQKFDLSNMFVHGKNNLDDEMCNRQKIQKGYQTRNHDNFSTEQDKPLLVKQDTRAKIPLCRRPEFSRKFDSPGHVETSDFLPIKVENFHKSVDKPVFSTATVQHQRYMEDHESDPVNYLKVHLNQNVEHEDTDCLHDLLEGRRNQQSFKLEKEVSRFQHDESQDREEDDLTTIAEFVPGRPWMSRQARKREDLQLTMHQIEKSFQTHKTDTLKVVYEILKKDKEFHLQGRNFMEDIQEALHETKDTESDCEEIIENEKKNEDHIGRIQEDEKDEIDKLKAFQAWKNLKLQDIKNQKRKKANKREPEDFHDEKQHKDNKKEAADNKKEDMELFGSYGSTLFIR